MNNFVRVFVFDVKNNNKFTGEVFEVSENLDDDLYNGVRDASQGLFFTIEPLTNEFDAKKHTAHYQVDIQKWELRDIKLSGVFYQKATGQKFEEVTVKEIDQYTKIPTPKPWSFGDICVYDDQQIWSYQSVSKETMSFFKYDAKHQIDAMLESVLQNEVFVSAIVSVGGQRKRVKIQSDLDTLQEIVQDGVNNGDTFSFRDRNDSKAAYWFENIKKSVAQELLKAVSDFKLKRSGSFRLEWYGKINHANSISEIQQIINDFSDIENNGSEGWFFENGQLTFNLAQDIDQIKVFAFLPAKTDVTSQFVSGLPDA
jgi:hypothetical protein